MQKLILLDVDGVLSIGRHVALHAKGSQMKESLLLTPEDTAKVNIPNKLAIHRTHTYRPSVLAALDALAETGKVEIKFLTNWGGAAKDIFSQYVGLKNIQPMDIDAKELGTARLEEATQSPLHWYKAQAFMREALERNREVLFIDDLINVELATEFDKALPSSAGWLGVNPNKGLTYDWIKRISLWVDGGPNIRKHNSGATYV